MRDIKIAMPRWLSLAGAVLASLVLRTCLLVAERLPFNSDEAVVGLMARHILQGERPVFFYGQAYMGSLDAWLVAAGFFVFGEQIWVIRLVQMLLFAAVLLTTAWLAKLLLDSIQAAVIAAWLMAFPPVNVVLYTTASLGGYGEALLLGNMILAMSWVLANRRLKPALQVLLSLAWGLAAGLGVWAFGLSLVYTLPAGVYLILKRWQRSRLEPSDPNEIHLLLLITCVVVGGLVGASPWWGFAMQHGIGQMLWELSGGAIYGVEGLSFASQVGRHLLSFLLLGVPVIFGLRPPWDVIWLGLPVIPLAIFFWVWVAVFAVRSLRRRGSNREPLLLLMSVPLSTALAFVFTPFGADPSGRYFLPMLVPMCLIAAAAVQAGLEKWSVVSPVRARLMAFGAVAIVCAYHLLGTVQSALRFPPGITTQFSSVTQIDQSHLRALADFLRHHGETRGYTNYWVAYPLAFISQEELVYTPQLPYHLDFRYTSRDNRYPKYGELVESSKRTAYVTTNHQPLDDYLRLQFTRLGITWSETQIGDFHVFYALSAPVRVRDIGLGVTAVGQPTPAP